MGSQLLTVRASVTVTMLPLASQVRSTRRLVFQLPPVVLAVLAASATQVAETEGPLASGRAEEIA